MEEEGTTEEEGGGGEDEMSAEGRDLDNLRISMRVDLTNSV